MKGRGGSPLFFPLKGPFKLKRVEKCRITKGLGRLPGNPEATLLSA
jgi:hypothetical protein